MGLFEGRVEVCGYERDGQLAHELLQQARHVQYRGKRIHVRKLVLVYLKLPFNKTVGSDTRIDWLDVFNLALK